MRDLAFVPVGPKVALPTEFRQHHLRLEHLGGALGGVPLSAGSRFFARATVPVDSEIVTRYKRAGLMILGRTNTPEFGAGSQTYNEVFLQMLNRF